jgi:hypothetical protein
MMPPVAERLSRAYPALLELAGVDSIPANSDAQNVPSFRRGQFEMKLSPCPGGSNPFSIPLRGAAGWLGWTFPIFAACRVWRPGSSRRGRVVLAGEVTGRRGG